MGKIAHVLDSWMTWILKRLRRITLSTAYLPEIDGLRFIAIVAVVFCHLSADLVQRHGLQVQSYVEWLCQLLKNFERGVHLFFAISGFILALPYARRYFQGQPGPDVKKYFRRRVFRMEPPYLVNVIIVSLATWAVNADLRPTLIWHFLTAVTYSHLLIYRYVNPINMLWWSLEIETQFYILMPLLALLFKIRNPWVRRGILIGVSATSFLWQNPGGTGLISVTILAQIQFFLAGMLAADLYQSGLMRRERIAWPWDLLGICAGATLFALPEWWRIPAPLLLLLVLAGALKGHSFRGFLSLPWVSSIGGMCYTIYLWHVFVMALLLKLTLHWLISSNYLLGMATQSLLLIPVIFFFCVAMFLLIEKPCMQPEWPAALRAYFKNLSRRTPVPVHAPETD